MRREATLKDHVNEVTSSHSLVFDTEEGLRVICSTPFPFLAFPLRLDLTVSVKLSTPDCSARSVNGAMVLLGDPGLGGEVKCPRERLVSHSNIACSRDSTHDFALFSPPD